MWFEYQIKQKKKKKQTNHQNKAKNPQTSRLNNSVLDI